MDQNFKEYLLEEYDQIASAHFTMVQTISVFFKHYLIIMAIPATVVTYFMSKNGAGIDFQALSAFSLFLISLCFLAVSFVGYFVCIYIVNLRLDAILYARNINGIRKYFYSNSGESEEVLSRIRLLPQNIHIPRYFERRIFLPVVFVFGFVNGLYFTIFAFFGSLFFYFQDPRYDANVLLECPLSFLSLFFLIFLFHIYSYYSLSRSREYGYLRSNIIGVDIDGVLNNHREMFCEVLRDKTGKSLDPDSINHIPVHEANLGISREQELEVFNAPEYWVNMPSREGIRSNIDKLKNGLNFNIMVFTHRPWPDFADRGSKKAKETTEAWKASVRELLKKENGLNWYEGLCIGLRFKLFSRFKTNRLVDIVTYCWLKRNGIKFNKLIVEKGSENLEHVKAKYENRFNISGNKLIRFFVEDDYEKAVRLSYICDTVFLIDHPYNKERPELPMPKNVIRVQGWNDLYKKIRLL